MPTETPMTLCQNCGTPLNQATGVKDEAPEVPTAGAVSICMYCGNLAIYGENLSRRDPTPEERAEIEADDEVQSAIAMIELTAKLRRPGSQAVIMMVGQDDEGGWHGALRLPDDDDPLVCPHTHALEADARACSLQVVDLLTSYLKGEKDSVIILDGRRMN